MTNPIKNIYIKVCFLAKMVFEIFDTLYLLVYKFSLIHSSLIKPFELHKQYELTLAKEDNAVSTNS